jgi:hypothetical protein
VHDAFGTTPTKTGAFAQLLRDEFAKMYLEGPLAILGDALDKFGVARPDLPPIGNPIALLRMLFMLLGLRISNTDRAIPGISAEYGMTLLWSGSMIGSARKAASIVL